MTARPEQEQPDWLIPAILVSVGAVIVVVLVVFFAIRSTSGEDQRLAEQMERWTTCLRSEGAPVPLVEPVGEEGFRVTVDDVVLDGSFDHDSLGVAFELCLDDAPEGVQTIAAAIDGILGLPFGVGDLGWLGPLLFELGSSGMFEDSEMGAAPLENVLLDDLCEQLSDLDDLVPDLALELFGFCVSESDV